MEKRSISQTIRILTLLFAVLFLSFSAVSASGTPALQKQLESLRGVERVPVLNQLSEQLIESDPDQSLKYAQEAISLSKGADALNSRVDGMNNAGYALVQKTQFSDATDMFQKAYVAANAGGYIKGAAYARNGYGRIWSALDDYSRALDEFNQANSLFQKAGFIQGQAYAYNNIGTVYESMGAHDKALNYYLKALKIDEQLKNQDEMATTYNNIGSVNATQQNFKAAFDSFNKALDIYELMGNDNGTADTLSNLGDFFLTFGYPDNALNFYQKALELAQKTHSKARIATALENVARVHENKEDFPQALDSYNQALQMGQSIGDIETMVSAWNNIGTVYNKTGDYPNALKNHILAFENSKRITFEAGLQSSLNNIANDYQAMGDFQSANHYFILYNQLRDTLKEREQAKNLANAQTLYETEKKDLQIADQQQQMAVNRQRMMLLIGVLGAVALFLVIVGGLALVISKEKKKSERLLLNILPKRVADELKETGTTRPERFDSVTVLFSDISGFTEASSKLDAEQLIDELSSLFTLFDNIMESNGCQRIKTIGDAYFAVSGMPDPNENHCANIARSALQMLEALEARNAENNLIWRIRIGIHSGPVVGGVVGVKKYIYDVFGDTVNMASRMESNGEPMRINVSETVKGMLDGTFEFQSRGSIEVKGKGLSTMYFLDREIPSDASIV